MKDIDALVKVYRMAYHANDPKGRTWFDEEKAALGAVRRYIEEHFPQAYAALWQGDAYFSNDTRTEAQKLPEQVRPLWGAVVSLQDRVRRLEIVNDGALCGLSRDPITDDELNDRAAVYFPDDMRTEAQKRDQVRLLWGAVVSLQDRVRRLEIVNDGAGNGA